MGFNLSGAVINKNYKNQISDASEFVGKLTFDKEITFQEASSNWKEDGICDVYFSDTGTIFFMPMSKCEEGQAVNTHKTLTFILLESSMVFNFCYCEGEVMKRWIIEFEGDRQEDFGEPLPQEAEDPSELIWGKIDELLGVQFGSIDSEAKAYRYKIG